MYSFVFLWTPALSPNGEKIPHGMIFACFMAASMVRAGARGRGRGGAARGRGGRRARKRGGSGASRLTSCPSSHHPPPHPHAPLTRVHVRARAGGQRHVAAAHAALQGRVVHEVRVCGVGGLAGRALPVPPAAAHGQERCVVAGRARSGARRVRQPAARTAAVFCTRVCLLGHTPHNAAPRHAHTCATCTHAAPAADQAPGSSLSVAPEGISQEGKIQLMAFCVFEVGVRARWRGAQWCSARGGTGPYMQCAHTGPPGALP